MFDWIFPLFLVLAGMVVIYKSAEKTTEYASLIARFLGISELAIGFILLSVATSMPELVISISAALRGSTDLSVGNVFGANISDILLVLGAAAVLRVVNVRRKDLKELVMILLATSILSMLFVIYRPGRAGGFLLFLLFLSYAYWMLTKDRGRRAPLKKRVPKAFVEPFIKFCLFV
ncbi:MAG: hypothetical protein ABH863_02340, partial [Candidatus Micrarchaeota archaeon]